MICKIKLDDCMNLERYEFSSNENFLAFQFESTGPKGKVLKVVQFTPHNVIGTTYFNLAFGDWDEAKKRLNDLTVTNNNDREKVLATVAATVIEFLNHYPDMMIYAQGSTLSRTRLYQISISKQHHRIEQILNIYGFANGHWEKFKKNCNYEAFLVSLQ